MKFKEFLLESRADIVLVDFQPVYDALCQRVFEYVVKELNKGLFNRCIAFYNGEELGLNSKNEVIQYYMENGVNEDIVNQIEFTEKGYGYLRDLMDEGVDDSIIIKIIRYLITNRLNDISQIDDEEMLNWLDDHGIRPDEFHLSIPDVPIARLKSLSGFRLGGGGEHECLREIELLCNALNIRYKRVSQWVY